MSKYQVMLRRALPPKIQNTLRPSYRTISGSLDDPVKVETKGYILVLKMDRPSKKNAIDKHMADYLKIALDELRKEQYKAAVIYGAGEDFCSGYDTDELGKKSPKEMEKFLRHSDESYRNPIVPCSVLSKKPVIAAIEGYAIGSGFELALAADIRVVASNSKIGCFNRQHNVPLIDGGPVKLPKMIGLSRALDMLITGRIIDGVKAEEWGLVNYVVEPGTAYQEAMKLAKQICDFPSQALLSDRRSAYYSAYDAKSFDDAMAVQLRGGVRTLKKKLKTGKGQIGIDYRMITEN